MTSFLRRTLTIVAIVTCVGIVATIATGWFADSEPDTDHSRRLDAATTERSVALARARRSCRIEDLDRFIEEQREMTTRRHDSDDWRVLAEAYLERALSHNLHTGMAVGKPVYSTVPNQVRLDLDLGDAALRRARELGDASSESYRIESALRTMRITGMLTGLEHDGQAKSLLRTALELDPTNPRAIIAVACRRLFTPFGNDPAAAEREFRAAADALPLDERPLIFAAMAAHLRSEAAVALELIAAATARNPANTYAVAVEARLRAGEAEPFARDVEK